MNGFFMKCNTVLKWVNESSVKSFISFFCLYPLHCKARPKQIPANLVTFTKKSLKENFILFAVRMNKSGISSFYIKKNFMRFYCE